NNQTVIPAALRLVKDHYRTQGKNFLITMAPEFPYLTASGPYTPYLRALEGYYDWINPQFYNQGGDGIWIDGVGWIAQNN
ncbi:chitinase, partial [Aeromonas hydrophila]